MPKLTIDTVGEFEIPAGKRLINAITETGIDQLHNCGGVAKCTSCRVQFLAGEPTKITKAERELLAAKGVDQMPGLRLSCQIECDHDMSIKIVSRLAGSGRADAGKPTAAEIQPPAEWETRI